MHELAVNDLNFFLDLVDSLQVLLADLGIDLAEVRNEKHLLQLSCQLKQVIAVRNQVF